MQEIKCPNCDVAMTYHKTSNLLHCHYCNHVEKNVFSCNVVFLNDNFNTKKISSFYLKVKAAY